MEIWTVQNTNIDARDWAQAAYAMKPGVYKTKDEAKAEAENASILAEEDETKWEELDDETAMFVVNDDVWFVIHKHEV